MKRKVVIEVNIANIYVYGNTFEIKEKLKDIGFRWDSTTKTWRKKLDDVSEPESIANFIKRLGFEVEIKDFDDKVKERIRNYFKKLFERHIQILQELAAGKYDSVLSKLQLSRSDVLTAIAAGHVLSFVDLYEMYDKNKAKKIETFLTQLRW